MEVDPPRTVSQVEKAVAVFEKQKTVGVVKLSGGWKLGTGLPTPEKTVDWEGIEKIEVQSADISSWDAGLLTFLLKLRDLAESKSVALSVSLPQGADQLYKLATTVPVKEQTEHEEPEKRLATRVGLRWVRRWDGFLRFAHFMGLLAQSCWRVCRGKARMRASDVGGMLRRAGPETIAIVSLISLLVGVIIAFLGAVVLQEFGAEIYIAYLVGYGMLREMGPIMAGIIVAGRNGAAFAAEIGTMKVNEEIDALETLGVSPVDFVVMPRFIALCVMMPLLTMYADVVGILGGLLVNSVLLDIAPETYFEGIRAAAGFDDFLLGVFKGTVFGGIIAVCGCMRGLQCGRSADEVGKAATKAVVASITSIIIANAFIDYAAQVFGI